MFARLSPFGGGGDMINAPRCFFFFWRSRPRLHGLPASLSTPVQRLPPGLGVALSLSLSFSLAAVQMLMAAARLFCTHTHTYAGSLLAITTPEGLFIHIC